MVCFKGQATFNPIGKIFLYYGNVTKGSKEFVFETLKIVSKELKDSAVFASGKTRPMPGAIITEAPFAKIFLA